MTNVPAPARAPSKPMPGSERVSWRRELREWGMVVVLAAIVLVLLGNVSKNEDGLAWSYLTRTIYDVAVFALFALGLSLQFGMTGLINFGYAIFVGVGAYTTAIVGTRWAETWAGGMEGTTAPGVALVLLGGLVIGTIVAVPLMLLAQAAWPARLPPQNRRARTLIAVAPAAFLAVLFAVWALPLGEHGALNVATGVAVVLGMLSAALFAIFLGLPTVRLREDYLAIVTIGAAEIMRTFWMNEEWLTRGQRGMDMPHLPLADWARNNDTLRGWADALDVRVVGYGYALVAVIAVVVVFILLETLQRSPWGRVLNAIREDEEVVAALGKNVLAYKLQSLAIGCAIAALAGVLWAWEYGSIYPSYFAPALTFNLLIILILGGIANHKGAIAGAIVFWGVFKLAGWLPDIASEPFFQAMDTTAVSLVRYAVVAAFVALLLARAYRRRLQRLHRKQPPWVAHTEARWFRPALVAAGIAATVLLAGSGISALGAAIERGDINTSDLTGPPQAIFVGLLLIVIMMLRPEGFVGRREELQHGK